MRSPASQSTGLFSLEALATHDALTGLVNRAGFDAELSERLRACQREGGRLGVLDIDVDGFKAINDRHGHRVGDELLRLFAARLQAGVRDADVVARLGGDEFAVLIDHTTQPLALKTAEGLIDRLSQPYRFGALILEVSASIGVAVYPTAGHSACSLLEAADEAMCPRQCDLVCREGAPRRPDPGCWRVVALRAAMPRTGADAPVSVRGKPRGLQCCRT